MAAGVRCDLHHDDLLAIAGLVEEQFHLWGIACFSYSTPLCFRGTAAPILKESGRHFFLLIVSLGLIAAGNGFAHWQYNPSMIFEMISTAMATTGILGVACFDRSISRRGYRFTFLPKEGLYVSIVFTFVVLPIIYGGTGLPFNLLLWTACFCYLWRLMSVRAAEAPPPA